MKQKKIIKIIIGVGLVFVLCIIVVLIIKTKESNKIKLGIAKDKAMSILDKQGYEYTESPYNVIINSDVSINGVKGTCTIFFEDDKVFGVRFEVNTDEIKKSNEEWDKTVQQLKKYLTGLYGKPFDEIEGSALYVKGNMYAEIDYEKSRKIIEIEWGPFNITSSK